ncbi:hypothetical protein E3Q06_00822 [Wallemia mellicola]|uniref:Mediator of RNA polymerase II transcription subunit 1 n=1 Tax=Wallemia mellicola TaxID=1708541 RepID=A0AB38MN46_9BASI|nr:hypothetical protein E3Q24_03440 [Wallemia mellicola]TIB88688.1 hypothetical protein E3Q21_00795 [Wallemia mellicola]TIB91441.1 hypothetical protein E3Q20_00781 [Wallemia mellicola]TIC25917.1 hypothetical protein E3Q12_00779 [Wallemia mellicola]TIC36874.1 hypothetical protein E3Q09_01071 [Wallemia mellicola]
MTDAFSLYFDILNKNTAYNKHSDVELLIRLKNLMVDMDDSDKVGKYREVHSFLKNHHNQVKATTNDTLQASAIHSLLERRSTYQTPYVRDNTETRSTSSMMSRIEATAKEFGLEAFQDQSQQADVTVHTVTIAGTILVIDVDLTSTQSNTSLTRLKTTYATNSSINLEPVDNLLIRDLDGYVSFEPNYSGPESAALQSERHFINFKRNLQQLVVLDKLSQSIGNQTDLFVNFEILSKAFADLSVIENAATSEVKHLHLYPSLDINGHGFSLLHTPRPYLTQVLHVSSQRLLDPDEALRSISLKDTYSIHLELRENGFPFKQTFPSKVQPYLKAQLPFNTNIQPLPGNVDRITAYAVLNKSLYLPKSACIAIQAALGYSDNVSDQQIVKLTWLDCIYQRELQKPIGLVSQSVANFKRQIYRFNNPENDQTIIKLSAIPFKSFSDLLRIIEILKTHLFIDELITSCLRNSSEAETINDGLEIALSLNTESLSIEVIVGSTNCTIAVEQNDLAILSNTLDEGMKVGFSQVIRKTRNLPIALSWLTKKLDGGNDTMQLD